VQKFKVRWKVQGMTGERWHVGPNEHGDVGSAILDARDVAGFEGVGPVEVFRDEGDAGVVVWDAPGSARS
jgi:hypothetical protein